MSIKEAQNDVVEPEAESELKNKPIFARLLFTQEQEDNLREAFNLLDYNGEGKIEATDFRVAIKALGYEPTAEELQHMINGVDKGASGKLSFENFQTLIMRKVMSLDSDGDIMKSFRLFDIDDTDTNNINMVNEDILMDLDTNDQPCFAADRPEAWAISFENLKTVTEILGTYLTDEEIEEMMDDADRDYDGVVSVQEFMKMIKSSVNIETP